MSVAPFRLYIVCLMFYNVKKIFVVESLITPIYKDSHSSYKVKLHNSVEMNVV